MHTHEDTDSIMMSVSDANLSNIVKPEFADRYSELAAFLFEDNTSPLEQSGLLKVNDDDDDGVCFVS